MSDRPAIGDASGTASTGPHERDERSEIARNTLSNYVVRGLTAVSILALTPYLFRRLGLEGFGAWSVVFAIATVFSLVEWGFSQGVTKFVAELRARGDRRAIEQTVGTGVTLFAAFGLTALAGAAAIALLAGGLAPAAERSGFTLGLIAIGAAMVVRYPCMAYGAALYGYQRLDLMNAAQAVTVVSFPLGAVALVEAGAGVLGVSIAFAGSLVLGGVAWALLLHRLDPELSLRPRLGGRAARNRFLGFSSLALLTDSMSFVATRMDTIVIAAIRNAAAAAPFAAAMRLQGGLQSLVRPFLDLLMPMASELRARGDDAAIARRMVLATRAAVQIILPVAALLALFASDIVDVWLGSGAPAVTADIIVALAAVEVVALAATPAYKVLIGLGRMRVLASLASVEGLANLGLSIVLVSRYGAIGAAIGTLATTAVLAPVRWPLACRALAFPTRRLLTGGVAPALLSTLPALAAMAVVHATAPAGAARLALGTLAGLGLAASVGVAQLGPRRILDHLGAVRGGRPAQAPGAPRPAARAIR